MREDQFFNLNDNPQMPDTSIIQKILFERQMQQPDVVIGNLIVSEIKNKKIPKTIAEELECIRRDTED